MITWITHQFETLNVLMLLIMIVFVTALSKSNNQKMLKEQSVEFYNDIEEIKDEIRDHQRQEEIIQRECERGDGGLQSRSFQG